jgi:hypothetical protein
MDQRSRDNALLRGVQWEAAMCRMIDAMAATDVPSIRRRIAAQARDAIRGRGAI